MHSMFAGADAVCVVPNRPMTVTAIVSAISVVFAFALFAFFFGGS